MYVHYEIEIFYIIQEIPKDRRIFKQKNFDLHLRDRG